MTLSAAPRISCEVPETRVDMARIFNIQRYSLNDGRGIRTVVFFKGCPHRCPWCANPESLSPHIQFVRRESKCLHCSPCLRDVEECPSGAFEPIGRDVSLDALLDEVMKDEVFFRASGGGVTLSGGEVLMQAPFAARLLARLHQSGVHTAIETAGDAPFPRLFAVASRCDEVLFDLKIMDTRQSKQVVKLNLPRVLKNFSRLAALGINVIPRLPLIPGYTLSPENLQRVLAFLQPTGITVLHLLPFHSYGEAKYRLLGRHWEMKNIPAPSADKVDALRLFAEQAGFQVTVGG